MKKLLAAVSATALLISPALAQSQTQPVPAPKPAAKPIKADPALWVVKDNDTTIYLFGTVHVLRPGVQWFDGGVKKAYDAAREVKLEMVEPAQAEMQELVLKLALDPGGKPLSAKLGPEIAALWKKTGTDLGLPVAWFEAMKPWFAATVVSVAAIEKAGFDSKSGVEKALTVAAKRDGKALTGFETAEQQLGFFDSLPEPVQVAFMKSTLQELPQAVPMLDAMVANWAKGKPDALAGQLNAALVSTPEIAKVLLTDRNTRWAAWIAERMKTPGTLFIAVGAGHLAGKGSVQDALKPFGLKAKRIPS
ncbi:MAG: TraB/GumN family protein [Sphingomonadaceae bacterium]